MNYEGLMADLTHITGRDDKSYNIISQQGIRLLCWRKTEDMGIYGAMLVKPSITMFSQEELVLAGIWDKLSDEERATYNSGEEIKAARTKDIMAKARQARKKVLNKEMFPKFLKCKCGREVKCNPYVLQKKADTLKVPVLDLINNFACQVCKPTKGRRKSE